MKPTGTLGLTQLRSTSRAASRGRRPRGPTSLPTAPGSTTTDIHPCLPLPNVLPRSAAVSRAGRPPKRRSSTMECSKAAAPRAEHQDKHHSHQIQPLSQRQPKRMPTRAQCRWRRSREVRLHEGPGRRPTRTATCPATSLNMIPCNPERAHARCGDTLLFIQDTVREQQALQAAGSTETAQDISLGGASTIIDERVCRATFQFSHNLHASMPTRHRSQRVRAVQYIVNSASAAR